LTGPRNPKAKGIFLGVRKSEYPNKADYNDNFKKYYRSFMDVVERDCGPNVWGVVTSHNSCLITQRFKEKGGMKCDPATCLQAKVRQTFHVANSLNHHILHRQYDMGVKNT